MILEVFFPPRWLLTCRCSWNRIGSIWAISAGGGFLCFEESVRKERGRGELEECRCCPVWPQIPPKSQKCAGQYRRTPVSCVVITRIRRLLPFRSPPTQSWVQNSAPPLGKLVHWNYSTGKRVNRFLSVSCKDTGPPKTPLLGYGKTPPSEEAVGGCGEFAELLMEAVGRLLCTPPPMPLPPSSPPTSKSGLVTRAPPLHGFCARARAHK